PREAAMVLAAVDAGAAVTEEHGEIVALAPEQHAEVLRARLSAQPLAVGHVAVCEAEAAESFAGLLARARGELPVHEALDRVEGAASDLPGGAAALAALARELGAAIDREALALAAVEDRTGFSTAAAAAHLETRDAVTFAALAAHEERRARAT